MRRILKKASLKTIEQIGRLDIDGDVFSIAADGDLVLGLVNGYRVVDSNLHEDPYSDIVPVMSSVISKAFRDKWYEGLKINFYDGEWDSSGKYPSEEFKIRLLGKLDEDVGSDNIVTHKEDRDSVIPEPRIALNTKSLVDNLETYGSQLQSLVEFAEHMVEKTEAILRIKLVESMWGVKEVSKGLDEVRSKIPFVAEVFNNLGLNCNLGKKSVNRLAFRVKAGSPTTQDDRKYIRSVLIPDMMASFDAIRVATSKLVINLAPIYRLEDNFRALTGNPVHWSIPGTLIDDFKEAYEYLVGFLSNIPSIEINVMEPLELLQGSILENTDRREKLDVR